MLRDQVVMYFFRDEDSSYRLPAFDFQLYQWAANARGAIRLPGVIIIRFTYMKCATGCSLRLLYRHE